MFNSHQDSGYESIGIIHSLPRKTEGQLKKSKQNYNKIDPLKAKQH